MYIESNYMCISLSLSIYIYIYIDYGHRRVTSVDEAASISCINNSMVAISKLSQTAKTTTCAHNKSNIET